MNILVAYRAIPQSPGWATGDALVRAFRTLGHNAQPYAKVYQQGEWLRRDEMRPDLLVYLEVNDADAQYLELSTLPCTKVYWEFDTTMHPRLVHDLHAAFNFDRVFLANPTCVHQVRGASYLPYAVDSEHFAAGQGPRSGVAILGHAFPERAAFCAEAGIELRSGIYREDYVAALQQLAIHVHHHDSGGAGLLVGRIWETLGAGALLLTHESPSIVRHFVPSVHLVTYSTPQDCRRKIEQLMAEPRHREEIAMCGHSLAMARHTYVHRARAILASLR